MLEEEIAALFPKELRPMFSQVKKQHQELQEIHIRVGAPVLVRIAGKEYVVKRNGALYTDYSTEDLLTSIECEKILKHICMYSLYAYEDELKKGYLTIRGGHRVGIAGEVVLGEKEEIQTIKNIRYMNIRIAHEIKGAGEKYLPYLYQQEKICNTLILSAPCNGKTTLLRDFIRLISNGNSYGQGKRVGVVDERSELAGCYMGVPQNDLGIRADILDGCPKALGMMMLIRAMAPQVIAVDELGCETDIRAVERVIGCGCSIIATIHADNMKELKEKQFMKRLLERKAFSRYIVLQKIDGICTVCHILGKDEEYLYAENNRNMQHSDRDNRVRI